MRISTRTRSGVTIVDLKGNITIGEGDVLFRETVSKLIEEEKLRVLINMAAVKYMDSAGVGELIRAHTSFARRGGVLRLLNLQKKTREILVITKLITVFQSFSNEKEAVESFSS